MLKWITARLQRTTTTKTQVETALRNKNFNDADIERIKSIKSRAPDKTVSEERLDSLRSKRDAERKEIYETQQKLQKEIQDIRQSTFSPQASTDSAIKNQKIKEAQSKAQKSLSANEDEIRSIQRQITKERSKKPTKNPISKEKADAHEITTLVIHRTSTFRTEAAQPRVEFINKTLANPAHLDALTTAHAIQDPAKRSQALTDTWQKILKQDGALDALLAVAQKERAILQDQTHSLSEAFRLGGVSDPTSIKIVSEKSAKEIAELDGLIQKMQAAKAKIDAGEPDAPEVTAALATFTQENVTNAAVGERLDKHLAKNLDLAKKGPRQAADTPPPALTSQFSQSRQAEPSLKQLASAKSQPETPSIDNAKPAKPDNANPAKPRAGH